MKIVARIDPAGRIVIPKELRRRYGFDRGTPVEIIPMPDGVSIVAQASARRFIRRGPILCIDTGAGPAAADVFDVDPLRDEHLDAKTR